MTITPEVVASIVARANPRFRKMHCLNTDHPEIRDCKLGVVFIDRAGDYCVYVGVEGRNRKFPCIAVRVRDRQTMKYTHHTFARVAKASQS